MKREIELHNAGAGRDLVVNGADDSDGDNDDNDNDVDDKRTMTTTMANTPSRSKAVRADTQCSASVLMFVLQQTVSNAYEDVIEALRRQVCVDCAGV
jgi:hypothetical protein